MLHNYIPSNETKPILTTDDYQNMPLWKSTFFAYCASNNIARENRMDFLKSCLHGEALEFFCTETDKASILQSNADYMEIIARLIQEFSNKDSQKDLIQKLDNLMQTHTVQEHYEELLSLYTQIAFNEYTYIRNKFINGLKDDIRNHVNSLNPKTIQDALRIAIKYESDMNASNSEAEKYSKDSEHKCNKKQEICTEIHNKSDNAGTKVDTIDNDSHIESSTASFKQNPDIVSLHVTNESLHSSKKFDVKDLIIVISEDCEEINRLHALIDHRLSFDFCKRRTKPTLAVILNEIVLAELNEQNLVRLLLTAIRSAFKQMYPSAKLLSQQRLMNDIIASFIKNHYYIDNKFDHERFIILASLALETCVFNSFTRDDYGNMQQWQNEFLAHCAIKEIPEEKRLAFLLDCVHGEARNFLYMKAVDPSTHSVVLSYKEMLALLQENFGSRLMYQQNVGKLNTLEQTSTVYDYYTKFVSLVRRVGITDTSFIANMFIVGLNPFIKECMKGYQAETLKEALRLAECFEEAMPVDQSQKDTIEHTEKPRKSNARSFQQKKQVYLFGEKITS